MSRSLVFIISLAIISITALVTFAYNTQLGGALDQTTASQYKPGKYPDTDIAINQAKQIYLSRKQLNEDLSLGPCLTNALRPGWVLDLVHNPRDPLDDLPENQCSAYLEGQAQHFVELDLEGNLVRFK